MERNEADPSNQGDKEEKVGLDRAHLKEELGGHHQTHPEMVSGGEQKYRNNYENVEACGGRNKFLQIDSV